MLFPKSAFKYLGFFLASFLLLNIVFSTAPAKKILNKSFCGIYQPILQAFFPKVEFTIHPELNTPTNWDILETEYYNKAEKKRIIEEAKQKGLKSVNIPGDKHIFYLNVLFASFLAFLLALFIITPLPWKSKLSATALGLGLFLLFILFKMFVKMRYIFHQDQIGVYGLEGFAERFYFYLSYFTQAGVSAIVVVLIWVFVVFKNKNISHLKEKFWQKD